MFIQMAPGDSTVRTQHLPLLSPDFVFSVTKAVSAGQQLLPFLPVDALQFAAGPGTWWLMLILSSLKAGDPLSSSICLFCLFQLPKVMCEK